MKWKRFALIAAAMVVVLIAAGILVVQSSWFHEKIRDAIVRTIADATGGRVSIGNYSFDWKKMRAEVRSLTIAGKEPAGKPPLLHADSVAIGLKIISLWKRDIDIQSLEVRNPRIYLIVYPDGSTNLPQPKVKHAGNAMDDILKLAIDRFRLQNGVFEIEAQGARPFDLSGRDLNVALRFDAAGPRYRGQVSVKQLDLNGIACGLTADVGLEKDRIAIVSSRITMRDSVVQASGSLDHLAAPRARFQFNARVAAADAGHILRVKLLDRGTVEVAGTARWNGGSQYALEGKMHAYNLDYRGAYVQLRGFRAEGTVSASDTTIALAGVRLSGNAAGITVAGQVANASLRADRLDLKGIAISALGGTFRGNADVRQFDHFHVEGEIAGVEARRAVAQYSPAALPWNSLVSGTVVLEGMLQRKNELRATGELVLDPAPDSAPVRGQVSASYDARTGVIDVGRSSVTLPNSRAEVSGAIGRQLRVHLETRDFDDLLPAVGSSAAAFPVKLANGSVIFDGTVSGTLDDPQAAGHLTATGLSYQGERLDSLEGDVTASRRNVAMRHATAVHGSLQAQFEGAADLHDWKIDDSSLIAGSGSVRDASVADLAALVKFKQVTATGMLTGTAQVTGAVGNPIVKSDVTVVQGTVAGEPFDRLTAHAEYSGGALAVSDGHVTAGPKQLTITANYDHDRVRFRVSSNQMPLESIELVHRERPDAKGMVLANAEATLGVSPALRVLDLHGEISAHALQVSGQPLGDAHLTANSQNQVLRAHVDSNFAGSTIKGDGEWKLEGDDPGSATIAFSRIDFAQLRSWLNPDAAKIAGHFSGGAEGQVHIDGPALKPQALKVGLQIPNLDLKASTEDPGVPSLTLRNSGPIVASLANSTITVDSMRLVGHDSDLSVTGKISLEQKTNDLRVNGRVDLAIVHDLNPDFRASGTITADATVRGTIDSPSVSGRTEFHNANFSVADLPNGLSNANGVVLFSGGRATIQSFSGETGGGKVGLTGFASYENGQTIFRIHSRVQAVRVRYPEGVSTVADASLNLTGTLDRSMLAGTVTVLRTGFNPQSDFSSLIAASAQPVQTASARAGFLGGLSFDIQINTAPDIEFQSSLTQDLQVEANLRLRGTFSNPALLGRVNLTQGQIIFFGTRYTINQGSVSFYNPLRVEPIFDIDLETKARGIDITLAITGPLNKLNLTPRSDPPLQFNEIVALLATGRTPTNDPTLLLQQSSSPQSWQQMGASALLGQAIASPVAGRLQRFFGVSKLRIDPSLPGVASTAQARLTLEQQVTPTITFTYITNVTTSNPQVVQVEWAFSKQWSAVAVREENGMFGIDFFYKRRF